MYSNETKRANWAIYDDSNLKKTCGLNGYEYTHISAL